MNGTVTLVLHDFKDNRRIHTEYLVKIPLSRELSGDDHVVLIRFLVYETTFRLRGAPDGSEGIKRKIMLSSESNARNL